MAARSVARRKPEMTVTESTGEPIGEVRVGGDPCIFGRFEKGASTSWLQYVGGALFQVHRTYYVAEVDWDGRRLHQIEVEYYEPEFPDARLWMQWYVEETEEAWRLVWWGQRYPNATAELHPQARLMPRRLRAGGAAGDYTVDAATYILDNGGGTRVPCLRVWERRGGSWSEYFVDRGGDWLYGRIWQKAEMPRPGSGAPLGLGEPDAATAASDPTREVMEREGRRHVLSWEQIPHRMMWAVWSQPAGPGAQA